MTTARQRSPNYPTIGLAEAIELAKKLYQKEKRGSFPSEMTASAWGYKSFSGPVRSKLSALRQYGLIDQKKGGEARVSDRALTIVLRNPASREYAEAIKEAALEPDLFRELYETRLDSSDDTLIHDLIVNRRFTDEGAKQFIDAFRGSMAIAGLTESGIMSGSDKDQFEEQGEEDTVTSSLARPVISTDHVRVPIQLLGGNTSVAIELPRAMSKKAWQQMMAILAALEPGWVADDMPDAPEKPEPEHQQVNTPVARRPLGISEEARQVIERASDGVPMYVTPNLERIAREHGITVTSATKPDEIIDQLRALA